MKNQTMDDVSIVLDGMVYLVARHFKISMAEARRMDEEDFVTSFAWATAMSKIEADELDKTTGGMKEGQRVDKTGAGRPFPGSEGW
tara:strand:+ start:2798 stop:3055 length:258 start_codon:yes stop_codon:yes gene_type:complete